MAGFPEGFDFGCGGEATETATADGTFESHAEVTLDFNCGDLAVSTAAGTDWSVEARHGADREPQVDVGRDSLRVTAEGSVSIPFTQDGRQEWEVVLPTDATLDLTVDANAASSTLDLADADLSTPVDRRQRRRRGHRPGGRIGRGPRCRRQCRIGLHRGRCVHDPGRIGRDERRVARAVRRRRTRRSRSPIESDNVDLQPQPRRVGLTESGNTWSSGEGEADITLSVDGNAASFTLNPEGGCD